MTAAASSTAIVREWFMAVLQALALRFLPLSLEDVEVEELRAMNHPDDDHARLHDAEDRPVRRVDEMPVLDAELGCLGNDLTSTRPLLEARDAPFDRVEPRRGGRRVVSRDV